MLDNSSQLLRRHDILQENSWLINAQDALAKESSVHAHFFYANLARQYAAPNDTYAAMIQQPLEHAILYVPKEKNLFWMLLDNLADRLPQGAPLYLVGSNKGGIKSLVKKLPAHWQTAQKIASGNHCLLFETSRTELPIAPFELDTYASSYQLEAFDHIQVCNFPGVFSEQKLDQGTQRLLEYLEQRPPIHQRPLGRVLDFACGSGVIAAYLRARYSMTQITASDVSAFAVEAAARTLSMQDTNFCPFQVTASDGLAQIDGRFDWVVTNPPFHTGQRTDYSIARTFFADVARQLSPDGRLTLVANSFLGYNDLLAQHFRYVDEVYNDKRFKIIEAAQPC